MNSVLVFSIVSVVGFMAMVAVSHQIILALTRGKNAGFWYQVPAFIVTTIGLVPFVFGWLLLQFPGSSVGTWVFMFGGVGTTILGVATWTAVLFIAARRRAEMNAGTFEPWFRIRRRKRSVRRA